jgi:hypothetical protein
MRYGYLPHALLVMMIVSAYWGCRDAPHEYPDGVATLCGAASKWFEINLPSDVFTVSPGKDRPRTLDNAFAAPLMAAATIARQAEHGQVTGPFGIGYVYRPNEGFEGEDRFTLQTIHKGRMLTLNYRIIVSADDKTKAGRYINCKKPPFRESSLWLW